ncbi:MAG: right-handed parallel beta-helix repeat-containing protein, partial [Candidatus Coatesbacteria bacterium]|nr:right-handed parallel beta-helix repeat-containing protein [Candidatus Coatesbacteria bacterium]
RCDCSDMTIDNCVISDNRADCGGGIYGPGKDYWVTIWNSKILYNHADAGSGGGIAYCYGAILSCNIEDNTSVGDGGGLFYCGWDIDDCWIAWNAAEGNGGGLDSCDGTIRYTTVSDNTAGNEGGGLAGSEAVIHDSSISSNYADSAGGGLAWCGQTIFNCEMVLNETDGDGGGFYECHGTIRDCQLSEHWAGHDGGAIFACHGTIINCLFYNWNHAGNEGGAIYGCNGRILNCTVTDNGADYYGGGLDNCHGEITNCIVWDNWATYDPEVSDCDEITYCCIKDWSGGGDGNISDDPEFASGPEGDFYLSQTAAGEGNDSPCLDTGSDLASTLGLDNCTTRTDSSPDANQVDMGFHYGSSRSSDFYVDESGNDTDNDGRTWATAFGSIECALSACSGSIPNTVHVSAGEYVRNLTMKSYVTLLGGYPRLGGARNSSIHETVINGGSDGSVITIDSLESVRIDGFTIKNGYAEKGGGIFCYNSSPSIMSNLITLNYAFASDGYRGLGGGIYCEDCSPEICNNRFVENVATGSGQGSCHGGGICCNTASPTVTGNEFEGNVAALLGGAIMCDHNSSPYVCGNTITGNYAWSQGGAISCDNGSSPLIKGNSITSNTSDGCAGISCFQSSSPQIIDNVIADNVSDGGLGGAILCYSYSSPDPVNNNLIYGNSARRGGAIYCQYYSSPRITNCTIADNVATDTGGGLFVATSDCGPIIRNCILWGNSPYQIAGGDARGVQVYYTDIQDGWTGTGSNNIDKDPEFVPTGDAPYTYYIAHEGVQAGNSPCVDAGQGSLGDYDLGNGNTTCTDGRMDENDDGDEDTGPIDMGYHYSAKYSGDGNTYIDLISFAAESNGSSIILNWETGTEIDNAGFVVFRGTASTDGYARISELIAAKGGPTDGASYSFIDSDVAAGVDYIYWLVDIETTGEWTAHGPVSARLQIHSDSPESLFHIDRPENPSYAAR